uniref:Uncharacterized protein n=1 Tax=viral metagenome TaxID=1070528 RepID=A0A6C0D071_9ZZZZ
MYSNELLKILMLWYLESGEYEVVYYLYKDFNVGIPARYIYKFPDNTIKTLENVLDPVYNTNNEYIKKIYSLFKNSKWQELPTWNNSYGYLYKKDI